jgi:hypothetical protein
MGKYSWQGPPVSSLLFRMRTRANVRPSYQGGGASLLLKLNLRLTPRCPSPFFQDCVLLWTTEVCLRRGPIIWVPIGVPLFISLSVLLGLSLPHLPSVLKTFEALSKKLSSRLILSFDKDCIFFGVFFPWIYLEKRYPLLERCVVLCMY